ncbi:MAG: hypothetical protein PHF14_07375 [Verrucomicrobiota bacterium]|jgi:uncharacterized membrane protein YphA (DoxX/SURF4 family)|nr:hypothetical protein [Verrucomicrobiota bacterium]MDD8046265.1 hypothetical protein [Verrucomicrobiota bacterium]MDD8051608.1 hypothetical protein [Verrucomicrobiota bacterium]MDI9383852.1 MauE/DoxX family redox-associated membrane protein [Verrucomicrobiota bacterium]HCF96000.1 hypothetical protein [Verrucomicrobiota bacterium]
MKRRSGIMHWLNLALSSPIGLWIQRAFLAAIWFAACKDKLLFPRQFRSFIERYQIPWLEGWPLVLVTLTIPVLELLLGFLLLTGFALQGALILTAGLMLAFLVLIGQAAIRGLDITNCGCFSVKDQPEGLARFFDSMGFHIVFDLFLLGIALFVYWKTFGPTSPRRMLGQRSSTSAPEPYSPQ